MITPGVVLVAGFVLPENVKESYYQNAQNYQAREEAKKGKLKPDQTFEPEATLKKTYNRSFYEYHEYMNGDKKSTGLFDNFNDELPRKKKDFYQRQFEKAYQQQGVMWIPIISFHNNWLKEQGIIDTDTGVVDDKRIKAATRKSITHLLKNENLLGNIYWTAAVHYNTDNIHVHVSVVEKVKNRTRGMMKQSNIDTSKAKIVSSIANRSPELIVVNHLMRHQILDYARQLNYRDEFYHKMKQVAKIEKKQYGRLSNVEKAVVDDVSKFILKKKFSTAYNKLNIKLDEEMGFYKRAYGEGNRHLYKQYKTNKEQELFSKMGNALLKQGELFRQEEFREEVTKKRDRSKRVRKQIKRNQEKSAQSRALFLMRKMIFSMENETLKAIAAYEELIKEAEYEQHGIVK